VTDDAPKKPGRKRTGTVVPIKSGPHKGCLQGIVTLGDGKTRERLKPLPRGMSWEMAREKTAFFAEQYADVMPGPKGGKGPAAPASDGAEWWDEYLDYRKERGLTSVGGLYRTHILPVIRKHPRDWTPDDCRAVRDHLDARALEEEISPKTGFNAWTVFTTACKAAAGIWKKDKPRRFKVRDDDPSVGVAPPDLDDAKELQWLYPDEFLQLVSCKDVPLERRRQYALAVYLFVRGGELKALQFREDVDVDRGIVSVRQAFDRETGEIKQTKTGNKGIRRFAIEVNALPLLRAMSKAANGSGFVVEMPLQKWWATRLRADLTLAGVKRPALFATDATRKRLRFHDLRSTGLTWMAVRGDDPLKIMQRAGHTNFSTTQKYLRAAEAVGVAIGEVFPALPPELFDHENRSQEAQVYEMIVEAPGIEPGAEASVGALPAKTSQGVASGNEQPEPPKAAKWPIEARDRLLSHDSSLQGFDSAADPVDLALATALDRATAAAQWSVAEVLARELSDRRRAHSQVVDLDAERNKRGRS
jgi:integrase